MVPEVSLDPIGLNLQLTNDGTSYKVTGNAGAAVALSTVKVYADATKGSALGTTTAVEDGSFEISFTSETALTSVYVSAIQGSMDESAGIQINAATASNPIAVEQLSYMVTGEGNGTLIGNAGAAVANSVINVYVDAAMTQSLATKVAGSKGNLLLLLKMLQQRFM